MAGDPAAADEFAATVAKHGLTISAFAVHGNPLHPDQETAGTAHAEFEAAVLLAERLGVKTVITFSGCPGDCETSKYPNWAVATWPEDLRKDPPLAVGGKTDSVLEKGGRVCKGASCARGAGNTSGLLRV